MIDIKGKKRYPDLDVIKFFVRKILKSRNFQKNDIRNFIYK